MQNEIKRFKLKKKTISEKISKMRLENSNEKATMESKQIKRDIRGIIAKASRRDWF